MEREDSQLLIDFLKDLTRQKFVWGIVLADKKEQPVLINEMVSNQENQIDTILQELKERKLIEWHRVDGKDDSVTYLITGFNLNKIKKYKDEILFAASNNSGTFFDPFKKGKSTSPANDSAPASPRKKAS